MVKRYRVTVDGTSYQVEVEETSGGQQSAPAPAPAAAPAPQAEPAPAPAPKAEPKAEPAPAPAGGPGTPVESPMPGKSLRVAVQTGAAVEEGDLLLVLEAMKMENEINAPVGGTVQELRARDGDSVNSGDVLAVIG